MTKSQNPNIPTPVNPVEIDRAIVDLNSFMVSSLSWLESGYGRAYKKLDVTAGKNGYFPLVYRGKIQQDFRYFSATPDNDKIGQCFFLVRRQNLLQQNSGLYGYLSYEVSIIFSVNLEKVNEVLLETEIFTENLIKQVKDCIIRENLGTFYRVQVNQILYNFDEVFAEFNMQRKQQQAEKAPLDHFRINCTIILPEDCP